MQCVEAGREVPEGDLLGAGIPEVATGQEDIRAVAADIPVAEVDTPVAEVDTPVADVRGDNKEDKMDLPASRHRTSTRNCPERTILLSLTSCLTTFPRSFRRTRRESTPRDFPKEGS